MDSVYTSAIEEDLVASFQNLVLNTTRSGNHQCLELYRTIIDNEIERLSTASESESTPLSNHDFSGISLTTAETTELDNLVLDFPLYVNSDYVKDNNLHSDIAECYNGLHGNAKYAWLSSTDDKQYKFGGKSYKSKDMNAFPAINNLRQKINSDFKIELDACLVIRYKDGSKGLSLHQDNEEILDPDYPILSLSIGQTRDIEFWDSGTESQGKLIKKCELVEGTLVAMLPGCQKRLWHKVPRAKSSPGKGASSLRYALSFRKLRSVSTVQEVTSERPAPIITSSSEECSVLEDKSDAFSPTTPSPCSNHLVQEYFTSTPNNMGAQLKPLQNGFPVHPDRIPCRIEQESTEVVVPDLNNCPEIVPEEVPPPPTITSPPEHLILGDSMAKGLQLPRDNTVVICKGGIHPKDVMQLLPASTDVLSPDQYNAVRSVTLIVGTNALNVKQNADSGIPIMDVICDYEKLIYELTRIFPNARVGLYNVLPRAYNTIETLHRIEMFNELFCNHVVKHFSNVFWIKQYWDFIDCYGYLRYDLYGRDGVHLKRKGKLLMAKAILNFQEAYY